MLRASGWRVDHVGELGMAQASDSEILAEAWRRDAFIITLDADFHTLLAITGANRPSVVRLRIQGLDADALASLLINLRPQFDSAIRNGAAISVDGNSMRIRHLPLSAPPSQSL